MEPTQYQLIRQNTVNDFRIAVNNFLKDGWSLFGETIIRSEPNPENTQQNIATYYQAMTK